MLCQECQGSGWSLQTEIEGQSVPCQSCSGCGIGHCCDGLIEQPPPDDCPERVEPWWAVDLGGES